MTKDNWIAQTLRALAAGESARVQPRGHSMRGLIDDAQWVVIDPVDPTEVQPGDVVFIRWKQNHLLHIALELSDDTVLIGNHHGKVNGWAQRSDILGRVPKLSADLKALEQLRAAGPSHRKRRP